jgi:hypothetical protein
MFFRKLKISLGLFIGALIFSAGFGLVLAPAAQAATNLNGRILLQVQDQGQAWYVNPLNSQRYYLGRPDDAFALMRSLGLGISNTDVNAFKVSGAPSRLAGRILLQVQDKGQAYYVDPLDKKLYYLGRPADAFALMRSKGLGITNTDLAKIKIFVSSASGSSSSQTSGSTSAAPVVPASSFSASRFAFKYQNNSYELTQNLSAAWYDAYRTSPKVYSYTSSAEPADLRNSFYGLFLNIKNGDNSLNELTTNIKTIAANNNWTDDQTAEFALAFIQYIPYDHAKLDASDNRNTNPYYPYETLYLNRGVCSDKTFLAVAVLRKLGYGAAILDFPDKNHSAVGIACPTSYSINASGYCYVETTNYFPFGVVPRSVAAGQAQTVENSFTDLFNSANLGTMEIYQKTAGKLYNGVAAVQAKAAELAAASDDLKVKQAELDTLEPALRQQEDTLSTMKTQMDSYYNSGQISQYNSLVVQYNALVGRYNAALEIYRAKVNDYNILVNNYNAGTKAFYQK